MTDPARIAEFLRQSVLHGHEDPLSPELMLVIANMLDTFAALSDTLLESEEDWYDTL